MERTYTVKIKFPENLEVDDWKVQNLIASQIESASVRNKETQERIKLRVKDIDLVEEVRPKEPKPEDFFNELLGFMFSK